MIRLEGKDFNNSDYGQTYLVIKSSREIFLILFRFTVCLKNKKELQIYLLREF